MDNRVQKALKRNDPNWRLKHACPACTNKLQNQLDLVFNMLIAMDGNDSLKRLLRRTPSDDLNITGPSNEHKDTRSVPGDYYISHEDVNVYARELVEEAKKLEVGASLVRLYAYFIILSLTLGPRLQSLCRTMEEHDQ